MKGLETLGTLCRGQGERPAPLTTAIVKSALPTPHFGHSESSGTLSLRAPGEMP